MIYYISRFKKIATFEIFPSKTVVKAVFFTKDPETNEVKINNLSLMGYQFKNLLFNMGMFFLIILFLLLLTILMRISKCFKDKFRM